MIRSCFWKNIQPLHVRWSAAQVKGVMHLKTISALTLLFLSLLAPFQSWAEDSDLARIFSRAGVAGTITISSLHGGETFVHDDLRANRRYPVASTFKILNTLISLEEGIISADGIMQWDGISREIPAWNRDQTLESAFRSSCVWCYQELARKVGALKYKTYLAAAAFGELREPFDETTFWLDGALTASAAEQVQLLKKIYRHSLPFRQSSYEMLWHIMLNERTPQYALWSKTGWATRSDPQIGWYVGWVETSRGTWFFAMNMDTRDQNDLPLRQAIALETLHAKGIIQ